VTCRQPLLVPAARLHFADDLLRDFLVNGLKLGDGAI